MAKTRGGRKPQGHPIIEAVVAQLPNGGEFNLAQRTAWLRLAIGAFDVAYGSCAPISIVAGLTLGTATEPVAPPAGGQGTRSEDSPRPVVAKPHPPRFFIDRNGVARRDPGGIRLADASTYPRINAEDVIGEVLFDDRGEHGDLGSILWADGTLGVLGKPPLEISATPAAPTSRTA